MTLILSYWPIKIFFLSFLSATVLPIPSEAYFSFLQSKNVNPYSLIILATLGNSLGGMTCFYLGRLGKLHWCEKYLRIKKEQVKNLQIKIQNYGSFLAFFCWLPIVGDPLAIALGFFRCSSKITATFMILGKLGRYLFLYFIIEFFSK